jgi:hypothetical protein
MYTEDYLEAAHNFSFHNKDHLSVSKACGCFCCLKIFDPALISWWNDQPANDTTSEDLGTGWCPYCITDSIIGDGSGFSITNNFLKQMNDHYVCGCVCKSDNLEIALSIV